MAYASCHGATSIPQHLETSGSLHCRQHFRLANLAASAIAVLLMAGHAVRGADAYCGNGNVEAVEDCDDGGVCIGGTNAGMRCTGEPGCIGAGVCLDGEHALALCQSDSDCPGARCVHCKTFGGDGCAANCTLE